MCGHGRLLVNVVFSLTGIFHGSAEGMSLGHTWHWGIPERSYQIPLGKPGLVIPRCETLASRSVTFPLHQRKVQCCTPPPSFSPRGSCNWGSKGKKSERRWRGSSLNSPTIATKTSDSIPFSLQTDARDSQDCSHAAGDRKHIFTLKVEKTGTPRLCTINILKQSTQQCFYLVSHALISLFKKRGYGRMLWAHWFQRSV